MDTLKLGDNTVTTIRTVLLQAAEILRQRGHCALHAGDPDGAVCVIVAVSRAAGGHANHFNLFHDALDQLKRTIGRGNGNLLTVWNERQTQASTIAMLERAALEDGE